MFGRIWFLSSAINGRPFLLLYYAQFAFCSFVDIRLLLDLRQTFFVSKRLCSNNISPLFTHIWTNVQRYFLPDTTTHSTCFNYSSMRFQITLKLRRESLPNALKLVQMQPPHETSRLSRHKRTWQCMIIARIYTRFLI